MSSRRNASLVVALGVASLAATSLAAMVATSELLVESFDYPVSGPVDPPVPNLGRPGVLQVEPPRQGRAKPPPGRSREPAAEPAPRPPKADGGAPADDGRAGVVVAVQRRPARQEPVASRRPAVGPAPAATRARVRAAPAPASHPPRASLAASAPEALDRPQAAPRQAGPGQARGQTGPAPPGGPGRRAGWRVALPRPPARGRGTGSAGSGTAPPGPRQPWRDGDRRRWDGDRRHRDEGGRRTGEPRRPDTAQDRHHDGRSPVGSGDGSQPPSQRQKGWPTGSK